jgi:AraC-like DNA-binding protein
MTPTPLVEQEELADLLERHTRVDGLHPSPIPRLHLIRISRPTEPIHTLHEPAFCLVAQGRKQVMLGEAVYVYDRAKYLTVSVDVPLTGQIIEASVERPYLCFRLDLEPAAVAALMIDAGANEIGDPEVGIGLADVTAELQAAVLRLARLLDTPADAPVLAPLAEREILYRLLNGPQGRRLRQIAFPESKTQQVNRAIGWIKRNYRQALRIESLAAEAAMSASAFHHHFKAITGMSPLQYQKHLRLQEARRLILASSMDVASAGHDVGYESPSQFSREYARLFGAPPKRDIARLRATPDMIQYA